MIPKQLEGMRFNRVKFKEKVAFENGWQKKPYTYNQIQEFTNENYGVMCGEELRVLDDDTPKKGLITLFIQTFGETFRVRDHLYFKFDNGHDKKIIFKNPVVKFNDGNGGLTNHMGEMQGEGTYVVGPGSVHPSGEIYDVRNDLEIRTISYDKFLEVFGEFIVGNNNKERKDIVVNIDDDKFIQDVKSKWEIGNRQELTMSVAGYLRKEKRLGLNSILEIIRRICMECGDINYKERMGAVRATFDKDEKDVKGYAGLKEQNITPDSEIYNIFTPEGQAKQFYNEQPYFYDNVKTFHLWNKEDKFWESCDEIDMLNKLKMNIPNADTINSKTKSEIITALKQVGRNKKPVDAPKTWVQFKNKIVDIVSGDEIEPSPKYYTTNPIPWNISDDASTPTIDRLIREWVVDNISQDESYIKTMKEIIAYTICSDQFLQRIFAFCGAGMNGKGTFIKLLTKFIGTKNYCASDIKVISTNNFESSALHRKLACIMGEVDASDLKNTNTIKKLAGEDDMRFEFKGRGSFTEESITTCLIATNSMPTTPDKSLGFYRRWLIVDFPHQFSIKRDLIGQIPDKEFENLGRACLNILKELKEKGRITNEGDMKEREARFEERSNPIIKFIEDECEETTYGKIEIRDFCNAFNSYLKSKHLRIISPKMISKILKEEGFETGPRKILKGADVVSVRCITNLRLKTTNTTNTTIKSSQNTRKGVTSKKCSLGSFCSPPHETEVFK